MSDGSTRVVLSVVPLSVASPESLRVTPAMEAGVADNVWSLEEVVALLD